MTVTKTFGELSSALKNGAKPAAALNENGRNTARGSGYLLEDEAVAAVDVAIELGRPLLVSGEPGVGKTELGYAVARMLQIPDLYLHSVKSTSERASCSTPTTRCSGCATRSSARPAMSATMSSSRRWDARS